MTAALDPVCMFAAGSLLALSATGCADAPPMPAGDRSYAVIYDADDRRVGTIRCAYGACQRYDNQGYRMPGKAVLR